jgi:hypothetical protein
MILILEGRGWRWEKAFHFGGAARLGGCGLCYTALHSMATWILYTNRVVREMGFPVCACRECFSGPLINVATRASEDRLLKAMGLQQTLHSR